MTIESHGIAVPGAAGVTAPTIQSLAAELLAYLRSGCERIEIAGSLRRGKLDPRDIEIVTVPHIELTRVEDMFGVKVGERNLNYLGVYLEQVLIAGDWELDRALPRNGPKYKRLRHIPSGVCADLFITGADQWGVIFAIRTGPADYSRELVTRALRLGMKVTDGQLWRTHRDGRRDLVPTPEERDFFAALGLPYVEPKQRGWAALA